MCLNLLQDPALFPALSIFRQLMAGYSTEELLCMRGYLDWLATRPKIGRVPMVYRGGDMPDSWRECLLVNAHDQHALGLFTFYVYVVAFHNVHAHVPRIVLKDEIKYEIFSCVILNMVSSGV